MASILRKLFVCKDLKDNDAIKHAITKKLIDKEIYRDRFLSTQKKLQINYDKNVLLN